MRFEAMLQGCKDVSRKDLMETGLFAVKEFEYEYTQKKNLLRRFIKVFAVHKSNSSGVSNYLGFALIKSFWTVHVKIRVRKL